MLTYPPAGMCRLPSRKPAADLAAGQEAEEEDQHRVLGRQAAVFPRRRNSSCSRPITFVAFSIFPGSSGIGNP